MSKYSQKSTKLKFSEDCTIYNAVDHYQKIVKAIHRAPIVKLDLSRVENVDSSFVQLLVCAHLEAERNKTKLEVTANSAVVDDLAALIYCQPLLTGSGNATASGE